MRNDVAHDWAWADGYLPDVRNILAMNAFHLVSFEITSGGNVDLKQATDMLVKVSGERAIAVRLRRPYYNYRDLTIRAYRISGASTELDKLREGHGDFYLYGWIDDKHINEWMLVDIQKMRDTGLLFRNWMVTSNKDGKTGFIAISYEVLKQHGCLVAAKVHPQKPFGQLSDIPF